MNAYLHSSTSQRVGPLAGKAMAFAAAAALAMGAAGGCGSINKAKPAADAPPAVLATGTLGPGDELEIKFYHTPELNSQQRIRPDGTISMQLIGDVPAAGLTASQLDEAIQKKYAATELRNPEVSVIVRGQFSQRVYVTGEVLKPGVFDMAAGLTVWEAVINAGGFVDRNADRSQIIVVRTLPDGTRQGYSVNMMDEMMGAATKPFLLQPLDIVYVPRETIVDVGDWIDKNVNAIIPKAFNYTVSSGNTSIVR